MYKKAWCTCKVVVLRNKPIAFLTSWLLSPSSLLKLPTEQTHGNVESICFIQWSEKYKDRYTYLHRTAWLFEDLCKFRHFFNPKCYVSFRLFLSFFILLVYSSWKSLNVFTCSKQNNGENILQSSKSVSFCRSDDLWWQLLWRFLAV